MLYAFQKCKHQLFSFTRLISIKFSNVSGLFGGPCRSKDVVARASTSPSIDLKFIPLAESYQKTLKNGIHSFPAWRSAFRGGVVENKPESSLVVSLGKALNRTPPPL